MSKFQLTVVHLLCNLLKRCDVKQCEEKNVVPAMLFDYIFAEVLIAAVYFLTLLFLDALNFSFRVLARGLSLRYSMAVR